MIPVYTYWEGPKPDWIELCLETMRLNIPEIQILNRDIWKERFDTGGLNQHVFDTIQYNDQSNWVRSWLLYHHGGIWIDADAIVFGGIRNFYRQKLFSCYQVRGDMRGGFDTCTALLGSPKGNKVAKHYHEMMVRKLKDLKDGKDLPLRQLGPRCLRPAIAKFVRGRDYCVIPARLVHQWPYWILSNQKQLFVEGSDEKYKHLVPDDAYCFMMTHNAIGTMRDLNREELLQSRTLPGLCWRRALANGHHISEDSTDSLNSDKTVVDQSWPCTGKDET